MTFFWDDGGIVVPDVVSVKKLGWWRQVLGLGRLAVSLVDLTAVQQLLAGSGEQGLKRYLLPAELACLERYRLPKRRAEWLGGRIAAKEALAQIEGEAGTAAGKQASRWYRFAILPAANGRPLLTHGDSGDPALHLDISISHSGRYAAAMVTAGRPDGGSATSARDGAGATDRMEEVSRTPGMARERPIGVACGIDLQEQAVTVVKVRRWFCAAAEEALLAASPLLAAMDEVERYTLAWTVKEAARKCLAIEPVAGLHELRIETLISAPGGVVAAELVFRRAGGTVPLKALYENVAGYGLALAVLNGDANCV